MNVPAAAGSVGQDDYDQVISTALYYVLRSVLHVLCVFFKCVDHYFINYMQHARGRQTRCCPINLNWLDLT